MKKAVVIDGEEYISTEDVAEYIRGLFRRNEFCFYFAENKSRPLEIEVCLEEAVDRPLFQIDLDRLVRRTLNPTVYEGGYGEWPTVMKMRDKMIGLAKFMDRWDRNCNSAAEIEKIRLRNEEFDARQAGRVAIRRFQEAAICTGQEERDSVRRWIESDQWPLQLHAGLTKSTFIEITKESTIREVDAANRDSVTAWVFAGRRRTARLRCLKKAVAAR